MEYAQKLKEAGSEVVWRHIPDITHGLLQMTAWAEDAVKATKQVAGIIEKYAQERKQRGCGVGEDFKG
ncbi:hypothetical protein K461DRAFT_278646 [Myriangium duriaei CBS 260.36]|uniref:Alpha/beta hydrolase fold-3 domain-containing protein n=1 Tax=Myriangium duriaei CBS 260.36 TaxID=1168546 RepID=A0A9P4J4V6_9PEZI|nr:hypothetical protein K461DRAFT_278646 [Myriangium duriaei CBS 260.36]